MTPGMVRFHKRSAEVRDFALMQPAAACHQAKLRETNQ
jgi:hypothetical protein